MLSLFVVSVLVLVTLTANTILQNIQDKANISVYFKPTVDEQQIIDIKRVYESNPDIKSISYISREQALEDFKENNANEQVILDSLAEIGENPLLASLVIKANNSGQYQQIYDNIGASAYDDQISRINYGKNKEIIDKLNSVAQAVRKIGVILGLLLSGVSILITFNAIRISIYNHRKEIEVMRLVGASNWYIRTPFIFEGILYGLAASIVSMVALFAAVKFIAPYITVAVPSGNLAGLYLAKFWQLFGLQLLIAVVIGTLSSWISMRKYLRA
jgi:cell division transport system permease protein